MEKIAIDVGGVLIRKKELDGPDTNFDIDNIKWMPGALDAIKTLHEKVRPFTSYRFVAKRQKGKHVLR